MATLTPTTLRFSGALVPLAPKLPTAGMPKSPFLLPFNLRHKKISIGKSIAVAPSSSGLYSAEQFDLTVENVDKVLENVRPYLIADGGNVEVASVENGVVSLKLQGACGTCPSSTTTMKMGIQKVLQEKFGDAIKDVCQVSDDQIVEATVEAVSSHLDILRPAIKNYGGSVQVVSIVGGDCRVEYRGPDSIGSGIKAAIKERFPDIINVEFIS